ncbi:MAG: non-ribosomal peptide synthetase, partial [Phycisphaerae bacterium]|nr:non-ribosomal peptide synthetase [Phycisphaerae bacterium]
MATALPTSRSTVEVRADRRGGEEPLPERFLDLPLTAAFAGQADRTGDRLALDDGSDRWTYRHTLDRALALAAGIAERSPDRAAPVAVRSEPSARGVVLMLGVMFSGRPLLCLDPQHPVDHLAGQIRAFGARLVIDDPDATPLPDARRWTVSLAAEPGPAPPPPRIGPADTAAIVSTSGSTGRPKGVIKTHASFMNTARYYVASLGSHASERHALVAGLGYMAAYPPIFGALLTGGSVHPLAVARRGVEALARWLCDRRISVLDLSPTLFRRLATLPDATESLRSVRLLRFSGETVRPTDVRLARAVLPPGAVIETFFGSAEAGLCCRRVIRPGDEVETGALHSGRPIDNQRIDLLNDDGVPVPDGTVGRIVVSGRTVSPGYANDAAATADVFADDPREPGARVFRSADFARRLPGGEIEHAGRSDSLLKVNGVRIDPGAVESAIAAVQGVRDAAVAMRTDGSGRERLVAWFVPSPGFPAGAGLIRSTLRRSLPREALPSAYVALPALPRTPSGKVDRQALPDPPQEPARPEYREPRDPLERQIAGHWSDVLAVERVGLDDSFEALGGTSLEAAALTTLLESTYEPGAVVPTVLATNDRLEDFVRAVSRRVVPAGPLVALQPSGRKRPFYFVHAVHGLVGYFGAL